VRIAFVSANRETLPDAVIPLGLLYIMASVPDGHEQKLIDLCFADDPMEDLRNALTEFQPDLIALSLRNIQNADYSNISDNLDYYTALIGAAKSVSQAPLVVGGAGFSVMPGKLMARLGADYGIAGEGEKAFTALVHALDTPTRQDGALAAIGGLHWHRDGRLVANSRHTAFLDMNALPVPDRSQVDPRYYSLGGIESVQTPRGCPLRCD
jgi:radical SAM superfamily enzyme YgiQ (UPF0313 family)